MDLKPIWINAELQQTVKVAAALQGISMRQLSEEAINRQLAIIDEKTQALATSPLVVEEEPTPCPNPP